jgi:hypothetical protein
MSKITTLVPGKRVRTIAGKSVDVSLISARVSIMLMNKVKERTAKGETLSIEDSVEIVALICQKSNPEVTEDFLLDNTTLEELSEFIVWVLEPLNKTKSGVEEKNSGGEAKQRISTT